MAPTKFLLLALFVVLVFSATVLAEDNKDSERKDREEKMKRSMDTNVQGTKLSLESKRRSGDNKDRMTFEIEGDQQLEVKMTVRNNTDITIFKVKFSGLMEYVDNGTANGWQKGEEVQTKLFTSWKPFKCSNSTSSTGANLFTCSIVTADNVFKVDVVFTTDPVQDSTINLKPTSVKIGATISNFAFTKQQGKVALIAKVVTGGNTHEKEESDEHKAGFEKKPERQVSFGSAAFFSWVSTATADSATVNVINSPLTKEVGGENGEQRYVFSFDAVRPTSIVWDPKLGVADGSAAVANDASVAKVSFLMMLISLIAAFLLL